MKKKILIHSIVFSPDGVSTAYLYNDIALKFSENDYDVVVLTTTPHYNIVQTEIDKQLLSARFGGLYYESRLKGIRVIHVPQKKFKSILLRMLGFVYWHVLSTIIALFQKNIDVILSPSPPLTLGIVNLLIGRIKSAKVIYNVQEIYPDFLINQGLLSFKPAISFFKWMEKFVYDFSDAVVTIDQVFYNTIVKRFRRPEKLHIIPNFVDTELFKPVVNAFENLDQVNFPEKSITLKVMYAGNIGHAQDWEPLLFVARELLAYDIQFWIIGEGVKKDYLIDKVSECGLSNVKVIPYQPREAMPSLIAYADLHFIFMSPKIEGDGFPSKVYSIMACGKPLLVTSGKGTPIDSFLDNVGCARVITSPEFGEKCKAIIEFLKDTQMNKSILTEMGNNGKELIAELYSKNSVTSRYVDLANQLIKSK